MHTWRFAMASIRNNFMSDDFKRKVLDEFLAKLQQQINTKMAKTCWHALNTTLQNNVASQNIEKEFIKEINRLQANEGNIGQHWVSKSAAAVAKEIFEEDIKGQLPQQFKSEKTSTSSSLITQHLHNPHLVQQPNQPPAIADSNNALTLYSQHDYNFSDYSSKETKVLKKLQDDGCEFPKLAFHIMQNVKSRAEEALIVEAIKNAVKDMKDVFEDDSMNYKFSRADIEPYLSALRKDSYAMNDDDYSDYKEKEQSVLVKLEEKCSFPKLAFQIMKDARSRAEEGIIVKAINEWEINNSKSTRLTIDMLKPYLDAEREEAKQSITKSFKSPNANPVIKSQRSATPPANANREAENQARQVIEATMKLVSTIETKFSRVNELVQTIKEKSTKKSSLFSKKPKFDDYQNEIKELFDLVKDLDQLIRKAYQFDQVTTDGRLAASLPADEKASISSIQNRLINSDLISTMQRGFLPNDTLGGFANAYTLFQASKDKKKDPGPLLDTVLSLRSVAANFLGQTAGGFVLPGNCKTAKEALTEASAALNTATKNIDQDHDVSVNNRS